MTIAERSRIRIFLGLRNLHKQSHCTFLLARSVELCANPKLDFRRSGPPSAWREQARTCNLILPEGSQTLQTAPRWASLACARERFDWIGPILRLLPARTTYFSHRLLPRPSRLSPLPRSPIPEICGRGRRKSASSIALSCPKLRVSRSRPEFLIHFRAITRMMLIFAIRLRANFRASPLMRPGFPGVIVRLDRISPWGLAGIMAVRIRGSAETWVGGAGPRLLHCR